MPPAPSVARAAAPVSAACAVSPQQAGPPPSPATSPRPLVLGGASGAGEGARRLAEQLQAGLMPLLDPRGQPAAHGAPALERPYGEESAECYKRAEWCRCY